MYKLVSNLFLLCIFGMWMWLCYLEKGFAVVSPQVLSICGILISGNVGVYAAEQFPRKEDGPPENV